jgi:hypothetical protein
MKAIRLILGLVVGGIGVAAGRRKGEVASFRQAGGRTAGPAWRACRPPSGKNSALASWAQGGRFGLVINSQRRISAKERETINAGLAQGKSGAQVAAELGRDASAVNREIARNGGRNSILAAGLGLLFAFVFILGLLFVLIGLVVVIFLIRRGIRLRLGLQGLILDPGSPRLERTKIILGRHLAASRGKKQAASVF